MKKKRKKKSGGRKQHGYYDGMHPGMLMGYGWDGVARPMPQMHPVSQQNVYIRGLAPETTDLSLHDMCKEFGKISSAKAIPDKLSKSGKQCCRGYGFVLFQDPPHALKDHSNERTVDRIHYTASIPHHGVSP